MEMKRTGTHANPFHSMVAWMQWCVKKIVFEFQERASDTSAGRGDGLVGRAQHTLHRYTPEHAERDEGGHGRGGQDHTLGVTEVSGRRQVTSLNSIQASTVFCSVPEFAPLFVVLTSGHMQTNVICIDKHTSLRSDVCVACVRGASAGELRLRFCIVRLVLCRNGEVSIRGHDEGWCCTIDLTHVAMLIRTHTHD